MRGTLSHLPNTCIHSFSKRLLLHLLRVRLCAWRYGENKHVSQLGALLIKQSGPDCAHSTTEETQNQSSEVISLNQTAF